MMAVTERGVHKITVQGCTQLLKTEFINNVVGYFIHQDPAPMLVMQPTVNLGESWSKDRLDKMIRDTPELKELVRDKKSRDSDNTILHKGFPGGHVTIVGSNSPVDLASRPIRVVLCDEVDKYPESAGKEGDPITLASERAATFWNWLVIAVCSPTIDGRSRINQEYEQSDKRVYNVPCIECGYAHEMEWKNVRWPSGQPEFALYHCPECQTAWSEQDRQWSINNGYWIATAEFRGHAGFRVSKLVSPWEPVSALAIKFVGAQKNPEKLKTFINTQLAETWKEKGEAPDWKRLYDRRESYDLNSVNEKVAFLTAGVDVQKDRLEVEVVGWGRDKQSWSVDYSVIMGDTATKEPWNKLEAQFLNKTWRTPDGRELQVRMMAVDSGFNTAHVYDWVRSKSPTRVRAVKGSESSQLIFSQPKAVDINREGDKIRRGVQVWHVGVNVLKEELYGWLKLEKPLDGEEYPDGYCHFPQYNDEYFKQLTAEQLFKRKVNGQTKYRWELTRERNEALDCRNYARAAAAMFGLDRMTDRDFQILFGKIEEERPKPVVRPMSTEIGTRKPEQMGEPSTFWKNQKKLW